MAEAELEGLRRSVAKTVAQLERLHAEKVALLEQPAAQDMLEELRYRVRVETRYVRMLLRSTMRSLEEVERAQQELARLPTTEEDLARVLATLLTRIDAAAGSVHDLLTSVLEKLAEEARQLGMAEGRSFFSQHIDLLAYRSFLEAWRSEQEIAQRLGALEGTIVDIQRSMEAAQRTMITPLISAAAYGVIVVGLFSLGFALLGVLAAIAAVGSLAGLAGKRDLIERLLRELR